MGYTARIWMIWRRRRSLSRKRGGLPAAEAAANGCGRRVAALPRREPRRVAPALSRSLGIELLAGGWIPGNGWLERGVLCGGVLLSSSNAETLFDHSIKRFITSVRRDIPPAYTRNATAVTNARRTEQNDEQARSSLSDTRQEVVRHFLTRWTF